MTALYQNHLLLLLLPNNCRLSKYVIIKYWGVPRTHQGGPPIPNSSGQKKLCTGLYCGRTEARLGLGERRS
jgi:hypothetical protein